MVTTTPEERIAQLLRLAEDQAGTPEGELAAAQAERLMVKHAIDIASLDLAGQPRKEQIITHQMHFGGAYGMARVELSDAVVRALGMRGYYSQPGSITDYITGKTTRVGAVYTIVGFESDVLTAVELLGSVDVQAAVAMKAWYKTITLPSNWTSLQRENHRRGFIASFGRGAAKRIKEMRTTLVEESSTGTQLAVIDRTKAVTDYMDNMRTRKSGMRGHATEAGYRAGQNANVGGRGIGAGQRGIGR